MIAKWQATVIIPVYIYRFWKIEEIDTVITGFGIFFERNRIVVIIYFDGLYFIIELSCIGRVIF